MSLMTKQLGEVWNALRAHQRHRDEALLEVRIRKLRGIESLRVPFPYPVSVLAGPNGCGKSTVLSACACAYRIPGRGSRGFTPTSVFPNFKTEASDRLSDSLRQSELEFHYTHDGQRIAMVWRRRKSWSRSHMGRKGGSQPERPVYLRTLANLTNPSDVRGFLQLGRREFETTTLRPETLIFAHRILPRRYRRLALISDRPTRDLLFAEVDGLSGYSEFHMSSGERSVLRMSKDVSELSNALVLIDEVETGLHPYTQQQTMLELQRMALRQDLQIVVASHSPVVIDSVPVEGRVFLDRDDATGAVRLAPPHRDIFQKALYGQSRDRVSILCEDAVAEGVIRGVLDRLNIDLDLRHEDVFIGRNTGKAEFPGHVRALGKFGKLRDFIVVLDGDSREMEGSLRAIAEEYGHNLQPLFLPGNVPPERWLWDVLRSRGRDYADELGLAASEMAAIVEDLHRLAQGAVQQRDAARTALGSFAVKIQREVSEIARIVGRGEARGDDLSKLRVGLAEQIQMWRQL